MYSYPHFILTSKKDHYLLQVINRQLIIYQIYQQYSMKKLKKSKIVF